MSQFLETDSHICKPLINTIAFVLYFHFLAEVGLSIIKLYSCYPLIVYQEGIIVRLKRQAGVTATWSSTSMEANMYLY